MSNKDFQNGLITGILSRGSTVLYGDDKEDKANKLTEYTEVETDEKYYSAKATNEMFLALNTVFDIYNDEYNERFATKTELGAVNESLDTLAENLFAVTEIFATKDYVNELIGGIENGSY